MTANKAALRKEMKARRAGLAAAHPEAGQRLAEAFAARGDWPHAEVVAGFFPMQSEIDPLPLLMRFYTRHYGLALPCLVPPLISGEVPPLGGGGVITGGDNPTVFETFGLESTSPDIRGGAKKMIFRAYTPGALLVEGPFGTRQLGPDAPEVFPDLILTPLLAFDRGGGRLGYGGGFYDRALDYLRSVKRRNEKPPQVWGVAFSAQEVPCVPTEPHDQRLDAVLTETGVIEIRKNT
ncbi:MAG: 5-formyltetrahydrofolate cyclo-ligase [Asticcacaulis sp.]